MITSLKENQIFVFGSNLAGMHNGGAALTAKELFGAKRGVGEGLTGMCYAFPTLDKIFRKRTKRALRESVHRFYEIAEENPDKEFLMTKIGCGIAGFAEMEMKSLFKKAPKNVILPKGWN